MLVDRLPSTDVKDLDVRRCYDRSVPSKTRCCLMIEAAVGETAA